MAAARDQAARILRPGPDVAESSRDVAATSADQPHALEEPAVRRPVETPANPAIAKPAAAANPAAPKSGKRKLVLIGAVALLALAAASYAVYYVMVGRFYISTDDAYVRANNTMLGARVAGHIAAIVPGDNVVVRTGDVIFRIDDGDYRIAVDAASAKIATQQATIDRIGRQVAAMESAAEQSKAQLASSEASMKRAGLDFERQQALSTRGFASRATFEVSEAGRDQGVASVKSAQAAYDAARAPFEAASSQSGPDQLKLWQADAQIGKRCLIGSCALVPPGKVIPDDSVVMGVPGKIVRQVTEDDLAMIRHTCEHYRAHGRLYKQLLASDSRYKP